MTTYAAAYVAAGLVLGGMDAVWLTLTSAILYRPVLGALLAPTFRPFPAILFYGIYLLGVVIFAVAPAIRAGSWRQAPVLGALFGLFCYATYDLTNQATLVVWSSWITVVDISWGAILTACAALAGYISGQAVSARLRVG